MTHFVRVDGSETFRPVCRTCAWAGAATTERIVAVAAAMAHGDLVEGNPPPERTFPWIRP